MKAVIFDMFETLITEYGHSEYKSREISRDLQLDWQEFVKIWHDLEHDRSIGKISYEDVIGLIMKQLGCKNEEAYDTVIRKRYETKADCFNYLHKDIIPVLDKLKMEGYKIGLISNCFSEEAIIIRESILLPYFDAAVLSYEVGYAKPDRRIYEQCACRLGVSPEECLYIGDGGCNELFGARDFGMRAVQAGWYIKEYSRDYKIEGFESLDSPLQILELLNDQ
ncbi:MAG: HAD-IA family hydrolase [Clostridiales bacterium]|nr:HAD-IA family hydrolase [Clostridiales bacterium]